MNDFLMIDFMQKDIIEIIMSKIKVLAVDWYVLHNDFVDGLQINFSVLFFHSKYSVFKLPRWKSLCF